MSSESIKSFIKLVRLSARAFYDDPPPPPQQKLKPGQSDNRGLGVLIIDSLTNVQWITLDDLANNLKMRPKQLRITLRNFEVDKIISVEYCKEEIKCTKASSDGDQSNARGQEKERSTEKKKNEKDNTKDKNIKKDQGTKKDKENNDEVKNDKVNDAQEKKKYRHTMYICLNHPQIYDVLRYKILHVKKKLKSNEDNGQHVIPTYICRNCEKRYSPYEAMYLINHEDSNLHCSSCDGVLDCENDITDPNYESNRQLHERVEEQLRPITEHLRVLAALTPPNFVSLEAWEAEQAAAVINESADVGISDAKEEHVKRKTKVMPPWMQRQGMGLCDEQSVEAQGNNVISSSAVPPDDSKSAGMDTAKKVHDDYVNSFYESLWKKQQAEDSNTSTQDHVERNGRKKRKREEQDSEVSDEDNIVSDDPSASGDTIKNTSIDSKNNKSQVDNFDKKEEVVVDMNEEDDDDIEWE